MRGQPLPWAMRFFAGLFAFLILMSTSHASQAFARTDPGVLEIKTIPAGRLLENRGEGTYFEESGSLFGPLFRYIQSHDIRMTTPVEAQIEPAAMYFWVAAEEVEKADDDTDAVKVVDMPERLVAAIGARGAYTEENFEEAESALLEWVEEQDNLTLIGEPYAVYWNGPMTPWFMKKFEVQVEVERDELVR